MQHEELRAVHLTPAQRERMDIAGRHRPDVPPPFNELTHRGTRIGGGRLFSDPNPDMRALHPRLELYDDMGTTDPVLTGAVGMVKESARSARFSFQVANRSATAGRLKDFAHWALLERGRGKLKQSFGATIEPLLSFFTHGFAYAEVLPGIVEVEGGRYAGQRRMIVRDLAFCEQLAHDQWVLDETGRNLVGITQRPAFGDEAKRWRPSAAPSVLRNEVTGQRVVSVDRIVRLSHRAVGHNYDGVGAFRPCAFPWKAKNAAMDSGVIAINRFGTPTPLVEIDRKLARERGYTDTQINVMIDEATANAANYIAQQSGYLKAFPGISYGVFGAGQINSEHVVTFVALCDRQMLLALLAQWILLGVSDVGSKASITQHRAVHARVVANILDALVAALQDHVVKRLIEWNFGTRVAEEHTPILCHHDVDASRLGEALGVIPGLIQCGALKPTQAFEAAILSELVGVESSGPLIEAANALPESMRGQGGSVGGVFKPGPGRPEGAGEI